MPRPHPIFRASAVRRLDRVLGRNRIDTCRIRRRTVGVGPDLQETITWAAPGPPVPCRVEPEERLVQDESVGFQMYAREGAEIWLPRDTVVDKDDRIDHQQSGETFDVLNNPLIPTVGLELICECATTELPQEDI